MLKKLAFFVAALIIGAIFWSGLQLFEVQQIECQLTDGTACQPELTEAIEKDLLDSSLFFTHFSQILHNEPYASLPYTLTTHHKELPHTLKVTFTKEPLQYVLITADEKRLTVGSAGSIVPTENVPEDIPTITIPHSTETLVENEQLNQQYHQPLSTLITSLYKYEIIFQNIEWISAEEIRIALSSQQTAILDADNPSVAIKKLDLLLESGEVERIAEPIREFDVRFDMPVLRTTQ